jgi:hypothetical protein
MAPNSGGSMNRDVERYMNLFEKRNFKFSTHDRDNSERSGFPTYYFRSGSDTGRIRQKHRDGPLIKIDGRRRTDVFIDCRECAENLYNHYRYKPFSRKDASIRYGNSLSYHARRRYYHVEIESGHSIHQSGGTVEYLHIGNLGIAKAIEYVLDHCGKLEPYDRELKVALRERVGQLKNRAFRADQRRYDYQ